MSITTLSASNIRIVAVLTIALATMLLVACGSDGGGSSSGAEIPQVVAGDRTYTIEDFRSANGVKVVKDYDVDELPGATGAWNAIFNQLDYEVRFYGSHEDALAEGTRYADSVTGEDAVVTGDEVLWEEGRKDRRKCSRAAQTPHSSCTYSARYLEYVIRGNMILFCEGDESSDAFQNCEKLMAAIDTPA